MSEEKKKNGDSGWLFQNIKWLLCFTAICSFAAAGLIVFSQSKQDEIDRRVNEYKQFMDAQNQQLMGKCQSTVNRIKREADERISDMEDRMNHRTFR